MAETKQHTCKCGNKINPIMGNYPAECAECRLLKALGLQPDTTQRDSKREDRREIQRKLGYARQRSK